MKHVRAGNEEQARAALHALGALEPDDARAFEAHLREGCAVCEAEARTFGAVAGNLGFSASPVSPAPEVRARVLAAARGEKPVPGGFGFALEIDGHWEEVEPGIFRRDLVGPGAYLIRMERGAVAARHQHARVEHCYVLSGDLHVAGRHIGAGDYHCAGLGTVHDRVRTDDGCLLLIVEAAGG